MRARLKAIGVFVCARWLISAGSVAAQDRVRSWWEIAITVTLRRFQIPGTTPAILRGPCGA